MEGVLTCLFNASTQSLTRTHFGSTLLTTEVKQKVLLNMPVYQFITATCSGGKKKQRKTAGEIFPCTGACEAQEASLMKYCEQREN